jgi:hypothetical protein
MRHSFSVILILACFSALYLICFAPALFLDRQFGYRDAAHYYYPLNQRVQEEWNQGRWPLWEPEENAGMPLLGNPTAAVLYPGKLIFAVLPYAWGARVYIVVHAALAFITMFVLLRSWRTSLFGSALGAMAYAFGAPVLFQYCNIIYLIGAAWLPLGVHAVDRWARLGRRWGLWELAIVLSMQVLGGDLQVAYLLGLASIGYALGLAWTRAASNSAELNAQRRRFRIGWFIPLAAAALVLISVVTVALAQWLPTLRATGKPTPPLAWMLWAPIAVLLAWTVVALGILVYWFKRGWRFPLGLICLGLAGSAALAFALTAAQLLPVIEFTQLTSRAARGGPHEIYPFSIEPYRLVEMVWPDIFGIQLEGNNYWAHLIRLPGMYPKEWVPSLYLGGLTLGLALSSCAFRQGQPWRVWFSVIAVVSLLGSLGAYTSPIWMARLAVKSSKTPALKEMLANLGPVDPADAAPVREDGYLRDGDGGFYWWLSTFLPGFRQFRFPAKLFTFTALALAALAGLGWDRLAVAKARGTAGIFLVLTAVTLVILAGVLSQRPAILAWFRGSDLSSLFGRFEPNAAYAAIRHSLAHAAIVLGLGSVVTILARRRPQLAGAAALVVMTADLAAANARYVLTVPQALFETKPEVLRIIEAAERAEPAKGPFRIHRMPLWHPLGWLKTASKDRVFEMTKWEHDTLQPKYGINLGVEYTHTLGVAELYDYEWYFAGWRWKIHDQEVAHSLNVDLGTEIVYFPRRGFDMWNSRYFIVPYYAAGWRDEFRGYASFVLFGSESVYPEQDRFTGPSGSADANSWIDTSDFRILRNLQALPRAWVVHDARSTIQISGLSKETRSEAMQEILYAADPVWNNSSHRAFDPRQLAWIGSDDLIGLRTYLPGPKLRPSETVSVNYPNPQQAVLDVSLDAPGIVVLADVYYPGWELSIDGTPGQPIYRVNGLMRGAAVSKGTHRLVYTFRPPLFQSGKMVSMAGVAGLLFFALVCALRPVDPVLEGRDSPA